MTKIENYQPIAITKEKPLKSEQCANPISPLVFCADPTAVEHNGRLYVYGTNDHQQYDAVGDEGKNSYESIKSIAVFSTFDMVNWQYHGVIDVAAVAPWIVSSWAPSICSRVEDDGLTHFYLYFSNNGCGVGVITATDPLGPWSDPLGRPLTAQGMPELGDCPNPFDPGVCIDGDGVGWLAFGGGVAKDGTDFMPGSSRLVRLGADMTSFGSEVIVTPAPYFFEASEMNYINGTYVYTYNTNWVERKEWPYGGCERPAICAMAYMTSKTPLVPGSWVYRGHYLLNAGDCGMEACNNHTHVHKYRGEYYVLHHTMLRQEAMGTTHGGFRSMCAERLALDEETLTIPVTPATREGCEQIESLNACAQNAGSLMMICAGVDFVSGKWNACAVAARVAGGWTFIKGADFFLGVNRLHMTVKGTGCIEVRLDDPESEAVAVLPVDSAEWEDLDCELLSQVTERHDIYFVFSGEGVALDAWRFV